MIKRRVTAMILSLAMVFTMTPMMGQRAYADDSQGAAKAAMVMGADVLKTDYNKMNAQTLYMADIPWRVIGYGGDGIASGTDTMTLISKGNLKTGVQFRADGTAEDANHYSKSNLIGKVNAVADTFSDKERAGIVARTLESGKYHRNPLPDCIAGDPVPSALLWPLSTNEADAMSNSLRMVDHLDQMNPNNSWWLRSPGFSKNAGIVYGSGEVHIVGIPTDNERSVRPAFNYDLDSVVFTSSATDGKISGEVGENALTQVGTNAGSEWKLTVDDLDRQSFKVTSPVRMLCDDAEVKIKYSGATTGENEYISAIVKGWNGKIKYYGRIANATSSSGTIRLNIGDKLDGDDKLYVFNEQYNGDKETDFSSPLREVKIRKIHDLKKIEEVEATCIETGVEAYWECDICNKLYEDEKGDTEIFEPVPIPQKDHTWDAGEVTKKPTITATGVRTYTCTVCGEKKTEAIAKLPKKNNTLKIKAKTAKVKYKKLKKKSQKLAVKKVIKFTKKGQGKMTYKLVSAKKGKKSFKKYFKINKKTGKVTIKKNKKMKKGTYRVKVRVKASGTATYKPSGWKNVTFKIKIK